jgi:hypothetical protein
VHLLILRHEVHRSCDEEDVVASGNGLVEATLFVQVGTEDRQSRTEPRLQVLEVGVLLRVIWMVSKSR